MDRHPLRRIALEEVPSPRKRLFDPGIDSLAAQAIEDVRSGGESALRSWAVKLGEIQEDDKILLGRDDLEKAFRRVDEEVRSVLKRAHGRVAAFAAAQLACLAPLAMPVPGGRAGHDFVPVARAGCYIPGGRYPLPSSAIMTLTPASVAGVKETYCAGPKPTDTTLAAAYLAGAAGFLRCGGAHSIAAMAFGVLLPPCDVIVGPGGRYVASAKRQLFGTIGTEAPAGPSELLVIADHTADPSIVAADLLAQSEHDIAAVPMLICSSETIARAVESFMAIQLSTLPEPNRSTAEAALANGWILVEPRAAAIIASAEICAAEHLELHVEKPETFLEGIKSAGAVFIGQNSAEVFGDYGAGPNHTLPTGGASRFASGLSVLHFLRARTWLSMDDAGQLMKDTAYFARLEGLEAHARAAESRCRNSPASP
jgi:phosphoribosyl-ATP pyrophosphohydrolase/phosphoribosyl-AMP cyclohydrolase/histidinol dehydrogenase